MGAELPKQFISVGGVPILMRTIRRFHEYSSKLDIIVVLPKSQQSYWQTLLVEHHFGIKHTVVDGGNTRFESSRNGLSAIPDTAEGVVGIHDGVRPFVSTGVIRECFDTARVSRAVVPSLPVIETLRRIGKNGESESVPRDDYRTVQTPQVFDIQTIKRAYTQPYRDTFTDDATVVERMGIAISLVEGNSENIKITTPADLAIAEMIIKR